MERLSRRDTDLINVLYREEVRRWDAYGNLYERCERRYRAA